jgi:hypothetical protein
MCLDQKSLTKTTIKLYNTLALPVLSYGSETRVVKARDASRISVAEMSTWEQQDTLGQILNKYTNCKGVKINSNFGQITGIQEKLDTTCKQNAS